MTETALANCPCDVEAVALHYDLIYAPLADRYPANAQIVLFQHAPADARFGAVRHVPLHDRSAFIDAVVALGDAERIDLPVAPRNLDAIEARCAEESARTGRRSSARTKRGGRGEVYPLPCLFLDLDVRGQRHQDPHLPTREQALALIEALPLRPTLVTEGPGGFHVYLALADLLDTTGDPSEEQDALARAAHWLNSYGEAHGFSTDTAPITATGGLRVAGTVSGKGGTDHYALQRVVHVDRQARYTATDINDALPAAPEALLRQQQIAGRAVHASAPDRDGALLSRVDSDGNEVRPGTRLAAAWPVSRMLVEVFGAELRGARVAWPRESGEVNPRDTHGTLFAHPENDDIEVVVIAGQRWQSDWGLDGASRLSSWDVLVKVLCRGDVRLAARVAAHVMAEDATASDRIDALTAAVSAAEDPYAALDAWVPRSNVVQLRDEDEVVDAEIVGPVTESTSEVAELAPRAGTAIAGIVEELGTTVRVGRDVEVVTHGRDIGVWRLAPVPDPCRPGEYLRNADGTVVVRRAHRPIADWYAYRETQHIEGDKCTFDVVVVRRDERVFRGRALRGMSAAESSDIRKVHTAAAAGVELPSNYADVVALSNVIDMLGHERRREVEVVRRTGLWQAPDGTHRFLGVKSSRSADGTVDDYLASLPRGVDCDESSDRPVQENIGWVDTSSVDIREAARAFGSLMAIAPARPEVGIALAGILGAAPIGAKERTTVVLVGKKDSAKSQAASCTTPFFSLVDRSAGDPMVNIDVDTMAVIRNWTRWGAFLPAWLDDLRVNAENRRKAEEALDRGKTLIQGCYNGAIGGQAQGDGGIRSVMPVRAPGIMTAERMSTQAAIVSRSVLLQIGAGDIEITDQPDGNGGTRLNGLDAFTEDFAETGYANAAYASLLSFIIRNLDERGELAPASPRSAVAELALWGKRRAKEYMRRYPTSRNAQSVGYIRMGWEVLFRWAADAGVRDLLPTENEVDSALKRLLTVTQEATSQADPGLRWIRAVADYIAGGRGHLVAHDGGKPTDAQSLGWRQNGTDEGGQPRLIPQGTKMGYISQCQRYVVLSAQGLNDAAAQNDRELCGYSTKERDEYLRPHIDSVMQGGGDKVSTRLGIASRPRGYVVTRDILFGSDTEADAPPSTRKPAGAEEPSQTRPVTLPAQRSADAGTDGHNGTCPECDAPTRAVRSGGGGWDECTADCGWTDSDF